MEKLNKGLLNIVATPIGNLSDISFRVIETLKSSNLILCEDTRVSQKLLNHFDIKVKKMVYNDVNKIHNVDNIIKLLKTGQVISLVTDAGTPLISDPGYILVKKAIKEDIDITSIPGPSASVIALTLSGFPPNNYYFGGFCSRKSSLENWENCYKIKTVQIFFESPKRIIKTLKKVAEVYGQIPIAVCRELTKMNEEIIRGDVSTVINELESRKKILGEITFLIDNSPKKNDKISNLLDDDVKIQINKLLKNNFSNKDVIKIIQSIYNKKYNKKDIYNYLIDKN